MNSSVDSRAEVQRFVDVSLQMHLQIDQLIEQTDDRRQMCEKRFVVRSSIRNLKMTETQIRKLFEETRGLWKGFARNAVHSQMNDSIVPTETRGKTNDVFDSTKKVERTRTSNCDAESSRKKETID